MHLVQQVMLQKWKKVVLENGNSFDDLAGLINSLNNISGGRVGDVAHSTRDVLLISGEEEFPLIPLLALMMSENWWVRDNGNEFPPFYSPTISPNSYDYYGLDEGDLTYVKFHFDGTDNTEQLVGFFTLNNGQPIFDGAELLAGTHVTDGTVNYIINDNEDGSGEIVPLGSNGIPDIVNKIEIRSNFNMANYDGITTTGTYMPFGNNFFFGSLNTVVTNLGGDVVLADGASSGSTVGGTTGSDVYLVGDYHVSASAGSDLFIMGLGSSNQSSLGYYQNLNYDQGLEDLVGSDTRADMDTLFVSWLPEGVTIDANFGSVSHGAGGPGSTVYTDYFAGIEVFDLTDHDDYFAGGGPVDINWISPGSGNDTIFWSWTQYLQY